ncbi:MAG: phytanoyl-CoA dioxygenase family protein [Pseudomonadales bacterium]|nr:phytanoyl-CoA dioxygenase family protein [Pseudomonadales bacterium]
MNRDENAVHQAILERPAKLLSNDQRQKYFADGYLGAEGLVDATWLERLWSVTEEFVEISRTLVNQSKRDRRFDLEPDHSSEVPRIRRLNSPVDNHEVYWEFASLGPFVDIAEDLLGPNVKFHHSKLNFKWSGGGEAVKWHQDIQFWPHTNYDVLTIGVYLDDVTDEMAPMGVIPKSHDGPLYDLYDESGQWTGNIQDAEVGKLGIEQAEYLGGAAGAITVHNCRSIHGSPPNLSERPRPLLLCAYSCADALPITGNTGGRGKHGEEIVRGEASRVARFDPRPVPLPPDWSKVGYKSIFEHQKSGLES